MKYRKIYAAFLSLIVLSFTAVPASAAAAAAPPASTLSSGGYNFLAIEKDGSLHSWGDNQYGTVGNTQEFHTYKNPLKVMDKAVSVSGSQWVSLAVDADGILWGWGSHIWGQLGGEQPGNSSQPVKIMADVLMASAGTQHCLAVKKDGSLWTWGVNNKGLLGNGETGDAPAAPQVLKPAKIMDNVRFAVASGSASYAVTTDGVLWGWGSIGIKNAEGSVVWYSPAKIMAGVVCVSGDGGGDTLAIREDGSLWVWGKTSAGQGN